MKEIKIYFTDEEFKQIKNYIDWVNLDNFIEMREKNYTVEDFVQGSALIQIETIDQFLNNRNININEKSKMKNRFKEIAKKRNIRQIDICKKLNLEKSHISSIFNNRHQPSTELFFKIWILLKCPPIHQCIYFED